MSDRGDEHFVHIFYGFFQKYRIAITKTSDQRWDLAVLKMVYGVPWVPKRTPADICGSQT